MAIERPLWTGLLEDAWRSKTITWLAGVRRSGKTVLCRSLPDVEYFDCELPRVRRLVEDPEAFLDDLDGRRIVLDEIHRLDDAAQLLKIASDHHPRTRIIATGSSTLGASARFRDTLAGRKNLVTLAPVLASELPAFGNATLERRMLRGGLPALLLSATPREADYQEWLDSFWARDVQVLFRLERRHAFQKLVELIMARSGGMFEATAFARPCEVSRQTIVNYLGVLEETFVAHVVRPFSSHRPTEIIAAPKVYGFDTGFVCVHRGWDSLRSEDKGVLWEHVVLNELLGRLQMRRLRYWRDKAGHEIDFIWTQPGKDPTAIQCQWKQSDVDPAPLRAFRKQHPRGENFLVVADAARSSTRRVADMRIHVVDLEHLVRALARSQGAAAGEEE